MNSELLQKRGLSLERLDSFCKIVLAGGLSQAADGHAGRVAQLSRQVRDLEEFFGVELLLRTGRGMVPTESGEELFRIIRHDLRLLDDFRVKCAGQPGVIRITAGNSIIHWCLGPRLGALAERLPDFHLEVRALRTFERVPAVRNHECDFAIVRRDALTPQLKGKPLLTVHHRLFVHRDLLAKAGTKDANKLIEKLPLALPPEGDFRLTLDRAADRHQVRLNVVLHVTSFTMAARAMHTGHYAAILPHLAECDFADKEFAILPVPLLGAYAQHLHLAWNPSFVRVSQAAAKARPALMELLGE
jgi:DNA-binding transcriptional LysR family regulator